MKFTNSELEMIYQYAAPTKEETLAGLKEIVPVIKDTLTRVIVENTIDKLMKIPEPECSRFIADTKAHFLEKRDNSIRRRLAEAKAQAKEPLKHWLPARSFRQNATHRLRRCIVAHLLRKCPPRFALRCQLFQN